jgi:hypothetical protein
MSKFHLTLKKSDDFSDWQQLTKDIMNRLRSNYGLIDEPDLCDVTILDYLETYSEKGEAQMNLKNLALWVFGCDWRFFTVKLGEIVLVGDKYDKGSDDFCGNCGSPSVRQNGDCLICDICSEIKYIDNRDYINNDISDYSGFISLS